MPHNEVKRWTQGLFSDIDDAISKFQKNFSQLKEQFQGHSALLTQMTIFGISESFDLLTWWNKL
jgi:hypothetical protein